MDDCQIACNNIWTPAPTRLTISGVIFINFADKSSSSDSFRQLMLPFVPSLCFVSLHIFSCWGQQRTKPNTDILKPLVVINQLAAVFGCFCLLLWLPVIRLTHIQSEKKKNNPKYQRCSTYLLGGSGDMYLPMRTHRRSVTKWMLRTWRPIKTLCVFVFSKEIETIECSESLIRAQYGKWSWCCMQGCINISISGTS